MSIIFLRKEGDFSFFPQSDPGLELPEDGRLLPEDPGALRARCLGRLFKTSSSADTRPFEGVLSRLMRLLTLSFLLGLEEDRPVDFRGLDREGAGGLPSSGATRAVLPGKLVEVSESFDFDMLLDRPR